MCDHAVPPTATIDPHTVHVCLFDDDPSVRNLVAVLLGERNIKVTACPMGWLAYHCISINHPNVILVDVQVPFVNGLQLFEALRSNTSTRGIPVIFLTAHPDEVREAFPNYEDLEATVLSKPFDIQDLRDLVQAKAAIER